MPEAFTQFDDCGCSTTWSSRTDCDGEQTYGSVRRIHPDCEGHWAAYEKMMEWIKRVREDGAENVGGCV